MEKIQQAIARARATREGAAPVAPRQAAPSRPAPMGVSGGALTTGWDLMQSFVPDPQALMRSRILTLTGGTALRGLRGDAASFDVLRTKTLQTMRANGWKRLAITSPTPGCGKSTITLNLAFSLARQPEIKTIVAELDLRRPSLAGILNLTPEAGFSDVLQGHVEFAHQALRYGQNLAISANPAAVHNPAELLQSASIGPRLSEIEAQMTPDLMIFDMPPMLVSDDMMGFARHVDCVLVVAAAEATTLREIDFCERELAGQTNVMGVVLNKCRHMGRERGYGYYN